MSKAMADLSAVWNEAMPDLQRALDGECGPEIQAETEQLVDDAYEFALRLATRRT